MEKLASAGASAAGTVSVSVSVPVPVPLAVAPSQCKRVPTTTVGFYPKGAALRKRCGQIKIAEKYNLESLLYLNGRSVIPPPNEGARLIVVSPETLRVGIKVLANLAVAVPPDSRCMFVYLQTVLSANTDVGGLIFRRELKRLLLESPAANNIVLLNEAQEVLPDLRDQGQKYWLRETVDQFYQRLIIRTCQMMMKVTKVNVTVLCASSNDPILRLCEAGYIPAVTLSDFVSQEAPHLLNYILADLALQHTPMLLDRYREHYSPESLSFKQASGRVLLGKLTCYDHSPWEGEVELELSASRLIGSRVVIIQNRGDMNRALDGDTVAVEVLSLCAYSGPTINRVELDVDESDQIVQALAASLIPTNALNVFSKLPSARVVGIIHRISRDIVVTVPASSSEEDSQSKKPSTTGKESALLVCPIVRNIPHCRLRTKLYSKLEGQRVVVRFDSWPQDSKFPNVHFVRTIGDPSDWRTDIDALLEKHHISPRAFSANALKCLPQVKDSKLLEHDFSNWRRNFASSEGWVDSDWLMPITNLLFVSDNQRLCSSLLDETQLSTRLDIRSSRRVFSVDPVGCQDIDDAMCVQWIDEAKGIIEVCVLIADVCAFVADGSALDLEAQNRGTTVYLPHVRFDMLPKLLSSDIASLHGNKDRFAVAVSWVIDLVHKDGTPVSPLEDPLELDEIGDIIYRLPAGAASFMGRVSIRSTAAMTYSQAHNLINGQSPNLKGSCPAPAGQAGQPIPAGLWKPLTKDLKLLTAFGRFLKRHRVEMGAVIFDQSTGTQLKFDVDSSSGDVNGMHGSEHLEIHSTIEELMVFANSAVASTLTTVLPKEAMIRIHPPASRTHMQDSLLLLNAMTENSLNDSDVDLALKDVRRFLSRRKLTKALQLLPSEGNSGQHTKTNGIIHLVTSVMIRSMNEAKYVCAGNLSGKLFEDAHNYSSATDVAGKQTSTAVSEAKAMTLAGHSGLGLLHYTHFTSPIRRYADVVVHRQLLYVLESGLFKAPWCLGLESGTNEQNENSSLEVSAPVEATTIPTSKIRSLQEILNGTNGLENVSVAVAADAANFDTNLNGAMVCSTVVDGFNNDDDLDALLAHDDDLDALLAQEAPRLHEHSGTEDVDDLLGVKKGCQNGHYSDADFIDDLLMVDNFMSINIDDDIDALLDSVDANESRKTDKVEVAPLQHPNANMLSGVVTVDNGNSSGPCKQVSVVPGSVSCEVPFSRGKVAAIAEHLNIMNRRSKRVQSDCQDLFLTLYFRERVQVFDAVVYSIRLNALIVYVPELDYKGALYLQDHLGVVTLNPGLVGEAPEFGIEANPSFQGRSNRTDMKQGVRGLPGYKCSILEETYDTTSSHEYLVISKPDTRLTSQLRFSVLQSIRVEVSAPFQSNQLRLRGIQLCLVSVDVSATNETGSERSARPNILPAQRLHAQLEKAVDGGHKVGSSVNTKSNCGKTLSSFTLQSFSKTRGGGIRCLSLSMAASRHCVMSTLGTFSNANGYNDRERERVAKLMCKLDKEVRTKRHNIANTGRIAFGIHDEVDALYLMEHARTRRGICVSSSAGRSPTAGALGTDGVADAAAVAQLGRGIAGAKARMEAWGEVWAEEEELPGMGSAGGEDGTSYIARGEGRGVGGDQAYRKEVQLASSRMDKLKIAKRRSKYDS
jgi:exoribonuclease R